MVKRYEPRCSGKMGCAGKGSIATVNRTFGGGTATQKTHNNRQKIRPDLSRATANAMLGVGVNPYRISPNDKRQPRQTMRDKFFQPMNQQVQGDRLFTSKNEIREVKDVNHQPLAHEQPVQGIPLQARDPFAQLLDNVVDTDVFFGASASPNALVQDLIETHIKEENRTPKGTQRGGRLQPRSLFSPNHVEPQGTRVRGLRQKYSHGAGAGREDNESTRKSRSVFSPSFVQQMERDNRERERRLRDKERGLQSERKF
jgi:hypothetical protein